MMDLLVDIGNTRIKWAFFDGRLSDHGQYTYDRDKLGQGLSEHWSGFPVPARIIVSNVAGDSLRKQLNEWVQHAWRLSPDYARVSRTAFGVQNAYNDINEYGVDRWLAVIAAWNKYRSPACIVDCGTAVTIDGLGKEGRHKGGLILPGITMMQDALYRYTSDIPAAESKTGRGLAISTGQAVANGCLRAIVSLVDQIMDEMREHEDPDTICLLTGGEVENISPFLKSSHMIEPFLVLDGLAIFAGKDQ